MLRLEESRYCVEGHSRTKLLLIWLALILITFRCTSSDNHLKKMPRSHRKGLAVVNFRNTSPLESAQKFDPWQYGIPAMLITDLESIERFNIVSRERLKDIIEEQSLQASGLVDPQTVVTMGKLLAAHYILTGSYTIMNDRMRIETHVFSVENGSQLGSAEVTGAIEAFFELEKELVFKVSAYLQAMLSEADQNRIANKIETKSVQASLFNYAGEMVLTEAQHLRDLNMHAEAKKAEKRAADKFNRALDYDPEYQRAKNNLEKLIMGIPLTL